MNKTKVIYTTIQDNVIEGVFLKGIDMANFVASLSTNEIVYLIYISNQVIITENLDFIAELFVGCIKSIKPMFNGDEISIQEYSSYEQAYKVALLINEPNKLCYEKK